jgi:GT2 family glycosyltransferase
MINKDVSIVLVNFNGHIDTVECLESIFKCNGDYHVYVVDNSNNNNSLQYICDWLDGKNTRLETEFPSIIFPLQQKPIRYDIVQEDDLIGHVSINSITLIKANRNMGFAAANNIALNYVLQKANSRYIWLLNNDTIITEGSLNNLVKFMEISTFDIGMIGSKLLDYRRPRNIQGVGGRYNKWFGIVKEIGAQQLDLGQWDNRNFDFDYVIGASMFLRLEFLKDIGLMNQEYFLYFEELDWAIRGKRRGWKMSFCHDSMVYHKMGASTRDTERKNSLLADFYVVRNRILVSMNYYPYVLISLYTSFIIFAINRVKRGQFERVLMLIKILLRPSRHFYATINETIKSDIKN